MKAEDWYRSLKETGWFDGLPKEFVKSSDKNFKKYAKQFPDELESYFQGLIAWRGDAECIYEEGDYTKLLQELSQFAGPFFKISNIEEDWAEPEEDESDESEDLEELNITVSFTINGKDYETFFECGSDYIDESFMDLVLQAVTESGNHLESIPTGGQDYCYTFANPEAVQKAQAKELLPRNINPFTGEYV